MLPNCYPNITNEIEYITTRPFLTTTWQRTNFCSTTDAQFLTKTHTQPDYRNQHEKTGPNNKRGYNKFGLIYIDYG